MTDKMKYSIVSILLYGCTTWMLTKQLEKKLDGNYKRMLRAILNSSWRQHPTSQQLYSHIPPITKTIKVRRTRHAGHCWRSKDELISDVIRWTPSHGRAKAGQPDRTNTQQLYEDTRCSPEDLPEVRNDREGSEKGAGISVLMTRHDVYDECITLKLDALFSMITKEYRCYYLIFRWYFLFSTNVCYVGNFYKSSVRLH